MIHFSRRAIVIAMGAIASLAVVPAFAKDKIYTGLLSSAAVGGYDPVAYFNKGKPIEGSSDFTTEHDGVTWYFESAENRDAFIKDPAAYAPQYGGHCAWAAAQGKLAKGDPNYWKIVNGKLYLNYNQDIQNQWQADIPGFISTADKNWPAIGQE